MSSDHVDDAPRANNKCGQTNKQTKKLALELF